MSLRIAPKFALPLDVAGEAVGLLATRGAGKSYTSAVIVEELYAAGVQTLVLDPTGVYWGLRGSGESDGLPLYVFGGSHGDLPLEANAGGLFADLAVDQQQSFVLDLSGFDTKAEQTRFVTAFAERLYRRKAQNRSTLVLVVDEADEFAPQRPMRDEPRMLGAMEAIVRRGRSRGLGVVLITQRSAALNKNVLDLVETLFVMRTLGPRDRKAVEGWIDTHEAVDELGVLDSLPSLPTGTAWVWSPVRGILEKIAVRRIRTFDSYRTPKPGEKRAEPTQIAPIDLAALGEKIAATAEKAKAEDPKELRKQIAALKRDLDKRPTEEVMREVTVEVPVPVFNGQVEKLETAVNGLLQASAAIAGAADDIVEALQQAKGAAVATAERTAARRPAESAARDRPETRPSRAQPRQSQAPQDADTSGVTPAKQRILDALAALEAIGVTEAHRTQLALFAKASPKSSGYANNLGALRTAGLVDYTGPARVSLTAAGRAIADPGHVPTTNSELHGYVFSLVGPAKSRILQALIEAYPEWMRRSELAEAAGASESSSGYANNLGNLRSLGLLNYPAAGQVVAEPVLFIE